MLDGEVGNRRLRLDSAALMPFPLTAKQLLVIIGLLILLYGFLRIQDRCVGSGIIALGVSLLLLGAGGRGTISYGFLRVAGPVGLVLIISGAILWPTFGC